MSGCATVKQERIDFSKSNISLNNPKIAVVQTPIPDITVNFPGADCLLCIGVAVAVHSDFRSYASKVSTVELNDIRQKIIAKMNQQGLNVSNSSLMIDVKKLENVNEKKLGFAFKDFSKINANGYGKLVIIDIKEIGFKRSYQSYVPLEPMKTNLVAEVYMVNIADNKLEWFNSVSLSKSTSGDWNNKPNYPEITNAYYSMIEEFKDSIIETIK